MDESEQTIAPTGSAATEFHISKPDGWPAGKYKLEVLLNGTLGAKSRHEAVLLDQEEVRDHIDALIDLLKR